MFTTDFSEFTFGYGLTRDLEWKMGGALTAIPSFPSLYEEGQPGFGYDVFIENPIAAFFIQFKVPRLMKRRKDRTHVGGLIPAPYYRMPLRTRPSPTQATAQHDLLIDLENKTDQVYYATPRFHSKDDINDYYFRMLMVDNSMFIRPCDVGALDNNDHYVAYPRSGNEAWLYSEPKPIQVATGDAFVARLQQMLDSARSRDSLRFSDEVLECVTSSISERFRTTRDRLIFDLHPPIPSLWRQVSRLVRVYFDAQLFILHRTERASPSASMPVDGDRV